ncbi:hypothetical protein DQ04_05431000 [Trypanosoma grayi]|uniref:hypothetical protein n=1 Tax=Trypanosoma grayi TaxID=71804 RepID=UPI0004F480B3|nr:hypothetical protein DQ04_05431000 [Trypanosoma grayi]KEG09312.1 hypothetical protein DQ04_05431000 [Trypanosoma grayi]
MEDIDWRRIAENRLSQQGGGKKYWANEPDTAPEMSKLQVREDITDDTISLASYWYIVMSPNFRISALLSLRITMVVVLPLMIISDRFQNIFPMYIVLGLYGIVFSQVTVGEQIASLITTLQTVVWGMTWGMLMRIFNTLAYPSAWWSAMFFGCFFVALFGDLRCRRFAILMTTLIMEVERMNSANNPFLPLLVARDMLFASAFALVQVVLPPFTMTSRADEAMAKSWVYVGEMVRNAAKACWAQDPIEIAAALRMLNTEPLHNTFVTVPGQLFFVMYEPWVSSLRLQLRRERLEVLRKLMPMLHAMAYAARALNSGKTPRPQGEGVKNGMSSAVDASRVRLEGPLNDYLGALETTLKNLGSVLSPHEVVETVRFDDLQTATSHLQAAIDSLHFDTMTSSRVPMDPVRYIHFVFFHLMMVLLSEELLKYAELMRNFDRKRYKSSLRRVFEFFFLDHWNDFWSELPKRLTLATPRDVRLVKDALKLACGYTVACAYTLYIDTENVYYFGMAILMGVGLPTAGESLMSGVQRVAGLVFATSIAFVGQMHHNTEVQKYAMGLAGVFASLFLRAFPAYLHCGIYCAMMIPTSMHVVGLPLTALSRLVANCFSVMTYYAIVVFVFPVDPIKVLHNTEVGAMKGLSDSFCDLMHLVSAPLDTPGTGVMEYLLEVQKRRGSLWATVQQVPLQIRTVAAEPTIRGMPYPVHEQEEFAPVLRRITASLDIILMGLLCIHRERVSPIEEEFHQALETIKPLVRNIDRQSRYVMQDFVDAVQQPTKWALDGAMDHFSALLEVNCELRDAFNETYSNILAAIRWKANQLRQGNTRGRQQQAAGDDAAFFPPDVEITKPPYGNSNETEDDDEHAAGRHELTAPRNVSFMLRPEEFTINHDMNMSIALLVGIDLFCSELEKSLRIMLYVNRFERSRRPQHKMKVTRDRKKDGEVGA